ncbi:MAG: hypothetical protein GX639_18825 [Fibrobacter sp.]|nr:hypothetical protein [Fibrobacter sp.]
MKKEAIHASGSLKGEIFMGKLFSPLLIVITIASNLAAQIDIDTAYNAKVNLPSFNAQIGVGFNYDLLRNPTDVSFEYPSAYFGFNVPLKTTQNLRYLVSSVDSLLNDSTIFSNGTDYKINATARQNANVTVRVDVPMLGGVGSFSNVQNMFLKYQNILGNPDIYLNPSNLGDGVNFLMRGTLTVPVELSLYWETMTFGYAYRLNKYFTFALNLHRHVFSLDLRGNVDVDMMGKYSFDLDDESGSSDVEIPSVEGFVDYPSNKLYGGAHGHFKTEVWSPTLAVKAWRFSLVTRFGIDTKAKGEFLAKYSIPFLIDPETFKVKYDLDDYKTLTSPEVMQGLSSNATDSMVYSSNDVDLIWKMPTGLTFSFDVWPKHLRISYSKLFGDISMKLDNIAKQKLATERNSERDTTFDTIRIDVGISVDHIIMVEASLFNSFLNFGITSFDVSYNGEKHLIGRNLPYMKFGKSAMLPVLNMGTDLGTKIQLHLELDVLPFPALKTGVVYHF